MALKTVHSSLDDIPEGLREHYREKDGQWVLDTDTSQKVDEFRENNKALFNELKQVKAQLEGIDLEEYKTMKEERETSRIESMKKNKQFDELLAEREQRFNSELQAERERLGALLQKERQINQEHIVDGGLRDAFSRANLQPGAEKVAMLIAKADGWTYHEGKLMRKNGDSVIYGQNGVDPQTVDEYVGGLQGSHGYLFHANRGAGTPPGTGTPGASFGTHKKLSEMTDNEKSDYVEQHGREAFERLLTQE